MAPGLSQAAANVTVIESNIVSEKVQDAKLCFRATRCPCTVNRPHWCRFDLRPADVIAADKRIDALDRQSGTGRCAVPQR